MSKITDYSEVNAATENNVFLLDGTSGTKIISGLNLSKSMAAMLPADNFFALLDEVCDPVVHRSIFRGNNLGTSITADQKARIADGTFKGLWLGDFWECDIGLSSPVKLRIVDFDYWYNVGNSENNPLNPNLKKHHIVVMPDFRLYLSNMNDTDTTDGGYYNSKMRGGANGITSGNLAQAVSIFTNFFGNSIMPHWEYLVNAVTNGMPSGMSWYESTIEIPSEIMMFGSNIRSVSNDADNSPNLSTSNKSQLALMQAHPRFINPQSVCWLRDVVSNKAFCAITKAGNASAHNASSTAPGVRPYVTIGGNWS